MNRYRAGDILKIPHTLRVVSSCWSGAETSLRTVVQKYHPGAHEEFVSQRFHEELAKSLEEASHKRLIEQAFLNDLKEAFQELRYDRELPRIAQGLIADVTWHGRSTEKKTGGDFGFVIIRPQISSDSFSLRVTDYRRGLLCQAKIRRLTGKWGGFTKRQKLALDGRLEYLALLLYQYNDTERRTLEQFKWQLGASASTLADASQWLKTDNFPLLTDSNNIIRNLGDATIGTDHDKVLNEVISPAGNPSMVIRITWPTGRHPSSQIRIAVRDTNKQQIRLQAKA